MNVPKSSNNALAVAQLVATATTPKLSESSSSLWFEKGRHPQQRGSSDAAKTCVGDEEDEKEGLRRTESPTTESSIDAAPSKSRSTATTTSAASASSAAAVVADCDSKPPQQQEGQQRRRQSKSMVEVLQRLRDAAAKREARQAELLAAKDELMKETEGLSRAVDDVKESFLPLVDRHAKKYMNVKTKSSGLVLTVGVYDTFCSAKLLPDNDDYRSIFSLAPIACAVHFYFEPELCRLRPSDRTFYSIRQALQRSNGPEIGRYGYLRFEWLLAGGDNDAAAVAAATSPTETETATAETTGQNLNRRLRRSRYGREILLQLGRIQYEHDVDVRLSLLYVGRSTRNQ